MNLKERIKSGIRVLLKYTLNPITRWLARRSIGPFSIVRHVGRRSGKTYETPILLGLVDGGFVIELTYGPNVDWYKNVQAAGGCTLIWRGKAYVMDTIEPLDAETGRAAFPLLARVILRLLRRQHYVKLSGSDLPSA